MPARLTMAFTGDIVPHRAVNRGAIQPDGTYDYTAMFSHLQPMLEGADLAICHLEAPVAPPGEQVLIEPMRLSVAAEIAPAIAAAGYDRCSTASNHSLDRGHAGIDATVNALEAAGVPQSGMARTPEEVLPALVEVNGVQVAHLSYTFSFNGLQFAAGEEWRSNVIEPTRIVADAAAMRAKGAQVVVVSLHWGVERGVQPTSFQRDIAHQLTVSGQIDLIVGHHAHVLQPIEQVNGVWVVWGMGNVLSDHPTSSQWPPSSQDAAVVTVGMQIAADGVVAVDAPVVHPTWCDKDHGYVIRFTSEADDPALSDAVRQALRQSEQRTRELLGQFVVRPPGG
ncbi:MAG: CapA family protein [Actinomycetota bacterium]|nr:CapA family protein [Actinomycetota bacterium]